MYIYVYMYECIHLFMISHYVIHVVIAFYHSDKGCYVTLDIITFVCTIHVCKIIYVLCVYMYYVCVYKCMYILYTVYIYMYIYIIYTCIYIIYTCIYAFV